jgi:hypothetical protein
MTKRLILFTEKKTRCLLCKSGPQGQSEESVTLKQMTRGDEPCVKDAVLNDPVLVAYYNWNRQQAPQIQIHLLKEI